MARQEPEQVELLRRQLHRPAASCHLPRRRVDLQLADGDPRLAERGRHGATKDGAHARGKLARRERLGDVVVGAELEPDDPIGLLPTRREHDHGQLGAGADPAAEREPVGAGQHDVEHDEVGQLALEQLAGTVAVGGLERAVAVALEIAHDDLAHDRLVVDHEDRRHARIVIHFRASIVATALNAG
jgi:D-alanyl-D-alanine carboxypeptidase/D-alanyl-D-alanine-endopeptidase (penicillin-binding protein 4)